MLRALLVFTGCIFLSCNSYTHSEKSKSVSTDSKMSDTCTVVAGIPYWDQIRAVKSLKRNIDVFDYVSLFWYSLDNNGNVRKYKYANEDRRLIQFAHENNVKVVGLIANLPDDEREGAGSDWDSRRVAKVINNKSSRSKHIQQLLSLSVRKQLDGIHIDYEALPANFRSNFTSFIAELSVALHKIDKILVVSVHPKTSEHNPREDNGSHAQDWKALYPYVDQLHLMTYDQHTGSNKPGPAASPKWSERILQYAVQKQNLPPDKLYFGIPLYGEAWGKKKSGRYQWLGIDITYSEVQRYKQKYSVKEYWDDKTSSPYMEFLTRKGQKRIVWFEDKKSIDQKLLLSKQYHLCNIAIWRLGGEDSEVWNSFRKAGYGR